MEKGTRFQHSRMFRLQTVLVRLQPTESILLVPISCQTNCQH